jgi:hypothetical protein
MKNILPLLICGFLFFSCSKQQDTFCIDATVQWMGNPAADGLGWVLSEDRDSVPVYRYYVPRNLAAAYQKNGLQVKVCMYKTSEKATCFCAAPPNKYHIVSITNR